MTDAAIADAELQPAPPTLGRTLLAFLNRLRLRLWDCRISFISVLLGLATLIVIPPVQDLLLEVRDLPSIVGFAVIVLVFWAIPVHHAAARAVEKVHRPLTAGRLGRVDRLVDAVLPHVLGLATLAVILIAARSTANSLETTDGVPEVDSAIVVLGAIQVSMVAAGLVFAVFVVWRNWLLSHPGHTVIVSLLRAMPTALGLFTFFVLVAALYDPSAFVARVGREDILPILFGGWVPAFSYLALLSHKTGWPITIIVLIVMAMFHPFSEHFHDVRTYRSAAWQKAHDQEAGYLDRQVFIDDAIDGWMLANDCTGNPDACPPAVLVAAEGGGSRAAFYTGTVVGALLDATKADPATYHDFGNAVFAMSGVSGGALGITLARTAMRDSTSAMPPCRHVDAAWTTHHPNRYPAASWRACLQLLAAGDFLSPTILGATFRDTLAMIYSAVTGEDVEDRAALLEQAIERHYNAAVTGEASECGGAEDERGLCRPFGYLPAPEDDRWLPLLFLNATSVHSGRQIIASDLMIGAESPDRDRCGDLYPFSYSVFEVLAPGSASHSPSEDTDDDCTWPGLTDADDVRLSTAVVMSARFPLVSPKGNLRNQAGQVTEQVIDGSFFDNTGLDALVPVVGQLRERGLHPLVIHIANHPWENRLPGSYLMAGRASNRNEPHHVRLNTTSRTSWADSLESLTSPLLALNSARSGHVERAEDTMMQLVAEDPKGVYVSPRLYSAPRLGDDTDGLLCEDEPNLGFSLRNLSMSWWLSPLVRHIIDIQLCDPRGAALLDDVLDRLKHQRRDL